LEKEGEDKDRVLVDQQTVAVQNLDILFHMLVEHHALV